MMKVLVALASSFAFIVPAAAQPAPPPSDLVTLRGSPETSPACPFTAPVSGFRIDTRELLDGTRPAFTVPAGKALVLTGMDIHVFAGLNFPQGVGLSIEMATGRSVVWVGRVSADSPALTVPLTGAAVPVGAALCFLGISFALGQNGTVLVHGYLTQDR